MLWKKTHGGKIWQKCAWWWLIILSSLHASASCHPAFPLVLWMYITLHKCSPASALTQRIRKPLLCGTNHRKKLVTEGMPFSMRKGPQSETLIIPASSALFTATLSPASGWLGLCFIDGLCTQFTSVLTTLNTQRWRKQNNKYFFYYFLLLILWPSSEALLLSFLLPAIGVYNSSWILM